MFIKKMKKIYLSILVIIFQLQANAQIIDIDSFQMVFVQGGTYIMGCTEEQKIDCTELPAGIKEKCNNNCIEWELPKHEVTLSNFYICKFEITQNQWKSVMNDSNDSLISRSSYFQGDDLPMESVSWIDVQKFIEILNERTGKIYRLPTEAEWEYAARGGNKSHPCKYSGDNNIDSVAWYKNNANGGTHPVGTKKANELGIYDMSGNVWEWCSDKFDEYTSEPQINPTVTSEGNYYILRGGSWDSGALTARIAFRYDDLPDTIGFGIGFRLVLEQ
jgi:formylglycine-generating enzyme required for sulfatase activity